MTDTEIRKMLKPCPFCGSKAALSISRSYDDDGKNVNYYVVICKECDASGSPVLITENTEADALKAVEKWNTRQAGDT